MGFLLPAIALFAFAALSGPKPSNKALPPAPDPSPEPGMLPPNVALIPAGEFEWGVTIVLGSDIDQAATDEAMDIIVERALAYPNLVFEVELDEDSLGIPVFFYEGGVAHEVWAEDVSYLGPELDYGLGNFPEQG